MAAFALMILDPGTYASSHLHALPFSVTDPPDHYQRWKAEQEGGKWAEEVQFHCQAAKVARAIAKAAVPTTKGGYVKQLKKFLDASPWEEPGDMIDLGTVLDFAKEDAKDLV